MDVSRHRGALKKLFRRRAADAAHGCPEGRWFELIDRYAPGCTFVDVGCMWQVNGEYAFHALERGATRVVGVDVEAATRERSRRRLSFYSSHTKVGVDTEFAPAEAMLTGSGG